MDTQMEACKAALQSWIAGWPDVRGWRFEVDWEDTWGCVCITTTHYSEGKIWSARDMVPSRDVHSYASYRAVNRYKDIMEAVACLHPTHLETEGV